MRAALRAWTVEESTALAEAWLTAPTRELEARFQRNYNAIRNHAKRLGLPSRGESPAESRERVNQVRAAVGAVMRPQIQAIPSPNRSVEDLIRDQAAVYARKAARWESKRGLAIDLPDPGPYGILLMGDPHVDDDGCDLERLCADIEFARETPHVYAANLGDLTNNWVGKLSHLWGKQHPTDGEAESLMDWLVGSLDWLFVILGNHDKWSPLAARICRDHGVTHVDHGATFVIRAGEGGRPMRLDARHTHRGHSMYNPAHAQLKRNYRGSDADVIAGGHTHVSAYTQVRNGVTGQIGHCLRVGAYKRFDEYADQNGFDDESISPSVLCVVDPAASPEGFVTVFHDLRQGRAFLAALREQHENSTCD